MKIENKFTFINDEKVIGKWQNFGWIQDQNEWNDLKDIQPRRGEYNELYFLPEGKGYWIFAGWTKGKLFIHEGGDLPVQSCIYEIKERNGNDYLLLQVDDLIEVFIRVDHQGYSIETLGRHDDIDLPFILNQRVIGKWHSCGFVSEIELFHEAMKNYDLCLSEMEFFIDGRLIQHYMDEYWQDKWTKGYVLSMHRQTKGAYCIKTINQKDYLFIEWKMGNYIYGGFKPEYYVFERIE